MDDNDDWDYDEDDDQLVPPTPSLSLVTGPGVWLVGRF
jgi:hypothetical protein